MRIRELIKEAVPEIAKRLDKYPTMVEALDAGAITEQEAWTVSRIVLAHFYKGAIETRALTDRANLNA